MTRWIEWRRHTHPVAFVLSGGGPLGALQVGLVQALFARGIVPNVVIGASVGALNAVFIANDPTPAGAESLRSLWLRMRRESLFPGGRLGSTWHALTRGTHLYPNAGLRRVIEMEVSAARFEDLAIPAHVVATALDTGEEAWFSSGPIVGPLLASCALPGVLPPVTLDGRTYIDGGVVNNVPVSKAIELGARHVYVIHVKTASQYRRLSRPHDFMMHGLVLSRAQRYRQDIEFYRRKAHIIEFPAIDVGYVPFISMDHTARLIETGFQAGLAFLASAHGKPLQHGVG